MKKKVRDNYLGFNDMSFSLSYFSPKNSYFPFIIDFYSSFLQIGYGQPVLTFCWNPNQRQEINVGWTDPGIPSSRNITNRCWTHLKEEEFSRIQIICFLIISNSCASGILEKEDI